MIGKNLELIGRVWGKSPTEMSELFDDVSVHSYRHYVSERRSVDPAFLCRLERLTGIPVIKLYESEIAISDIPLKPLSLQNPHSRIQNPGIGMVQGESPLYGEIKKMKEHLDELEKKVLANQ
jgi:hypothetical protein